jgi:bile acid-coenzyme A ligase
VVRGVAPASTARSRDGWDSLGDLGWYIDDGCQRFFYLSVRRVDMFTVGGRNVYPAEIEAALAAHPHVLPCLVVGVADDDLGQVPHALVQAGASLGGPRNPPASARRRAPASR